MSRLMLQQMYIASSSLSPVFFVSVTKHEVLGQKPRIFLDDIAFAG